MIVSLGKPGWRNLRQRLCSAVTLLAYLAAAIGYPVPETFASRGQTANGCGRQVCCCGSAEQCRASGCCCSHHTPVPQEDVPRQDEPAPDCCSERPKAPPAAKSSCSVRETPQSPGAQEPKKTPTKSKHASMRWVVGISALKCRGAVTQWVSAQAALPAEAPLCWQPIWPYCRSLPVSHDRSFVLTMDLPDPPPRLEAI
jgi:hypothetical protein